MAPILLAPPPLQDSHWINLVWSQQFTAEMAGGTLWPRWLPASHDGLGAPVFYFYAPVAFWLAGAFGMAGLTTWPAIAATATGTLIASGWGMLSLLRQRGAERPLAGAAFFMAAPYHLLDFARRGAFAEFVAIALLPWVALALSRAARGRPTIFALLYAALICTHLPIALLASVFLLPVLIFENHRDRPALFQIAGALALGVALSAAYMVPALCLQGATSMAIMQADPMQRPGLWSPLSYWRGNVFALQFLFAIGAVLVIAAASLPNAGRWRWHVIAIAALALGLASPIWMLPPLNRVQFPWRALALAEFGLAIIVGSSRIKDIRLLITIAPALILSCLVLAPAAATIGDPPSPKMHFLFERHPDVAEYLPAGIAAAWRDPSDHALQIARTMSGPVDRHGVTTLRRFAFPIWHARCADRLSPVGVSDDGLIELPTGCVLVRSAPLPERLGNALSFCALLCIGIMAARRRFRR